MCVTCSPGLPPIRMEIASPPAVLSSAVIPISGCSRDSVLQATLTVDGCSGTRVADPFSLAGSPAERSYIMNAKFAAVLLVAGALVAAPLAGHADKYDASGKKESVKEHVEDGWITT